jgi:hypothetical protein
MLRESRALRLGLTRAHHLVSTLVLSYVFSGSSAVGR